MVLVNLNKIDLVQVLFEVKCCALNAMHPRQCRDDLNHFHQNRKSRIRIVAQYLTYA